MLKTSCTLILFLCLSSASIAQQSQNQDYLSWTSRQAFNIGTKWRVAGRVGWGSRSNPFSSENCFYDVRATLMTAEAIRAAARLEQLRRHFTDAETQELVMEAEKIDGLVAIIEINPREGSGIIPLTWHAILQPKGAKEGSPLSILGINRPDLRQFRALTTVAPRNYDYDVFWVVFPMKDREGKSIWETPPETIEIVINIGEKHGRMSWRVNDSLRQRLLSSN
jgi:hypothetical protein